MPELTASLTPVTVLGRELSFNDWLYYLCWTVALVGYVIAWLLLRGRTGRALRAVRDSETAAQSSGVSLAKYKTLAFGVSAAYAGVAGSLFAIATTFVNPDTFPIALSILLLVGVVIGGLGSLVGLDRRGGLHPVPADLVAGGLEVAGRAGRGLGRAPDRADVRPAHGRGGAGRPPENAYEALTRRGYHRPHPQVVRDVPLPDPRSPSPMTRKLAFALTALALTLATGVTAAFAGTGGAAADPGVTATSILLGTTSPLSGPASAYASVARGADAYFKYVNARGRRQRPQDPVHDPRRRLQPRADGAGDAPARRAGQACSRSSTRSAPSRTSPSATTSTPRRCRSSSPRRARPRSARETAKYPYTIGLPAELPGGRLGAREVPGAHAGGGEGRRAVPERRLRQGPAQRPEEGHPAVGGEDRRRPAVRGDGQRRAVADREAALVGREHVRRLRARRSSRSRPTSTRTSSAGSRSCRSTNAVSSASNIMQLASEGGTNKVVEGSVSIVFLKDPTDPRWTNDSAMKLYRTIMKRYASGANVSDVVPRLRHGRGVDGRRGDPQGAARTSRARASSRWRTA